MTKKANKAQRGKDKYYQLAKEQGYRARSAFKLIQLNKKHDFLAHAHVCIDLCAAPGGWLQVAAKYMPTDSSIIGVDLMPIKPIRGVITHQEDITTPQCRSVLKRDLGGKMADIVLHDGAPNVGQNWNKDAYTQSELVLCSLKLATEFLRARGMFITKIFRSADYNSLLWVFHQLFGKVEATKPHSSRNASAEIFVVCKDYKCPDKIDPKLLDPRYVFKETEESAGTGVGVAGGGGANALSVLDRKAGLHNKRQRDGYDESLGPLLTKPVSVLEFLRSENPVRILTDASRLDFDEEATALGLHTHSDTNTEVLDCCKDLKVLGKKEFKNLLRWRLAIRRHVPQLLQEDEADADAGSGSGSGSDDSAGDSSETDSSEEDMQELSLAAQEELRRRKREEKRNAKLRAKALRRQRLGMNLRSVDLLDSDKSLFNLRELGRMASKLGGDALAEIADIDLEKSKIDLDNADVADGDESHTALDQPAEDLSEDSEDGEDTLPLADRLKNADRKARFADMEENFDRDYATYLAKKEKREAEVKAAMTKGAGPSAGIKLTRRQRLEQQAVLTEAALNGQLDAEHQRYVKLLGGVRAAAGAGAVAAEAAGITSGVTAPISGVKRRRSDSEASDDEFESEDSNESDDSEEESTSGFGASASKASRWFSNPIFANVMDPTKLSSANNKSLTISGRADQQNNSSDSDSDAVPSEGWLDGIPKSEREKRKERLRKKRDLADKRARKAEKDAIEIVSGSGGHLDDADAQFEQVTRAALGAVDSDVEMDKGVIAKRELLRKGMGKAVEPGETEGGFEIVPAGKHDDVDSDSDGDSDDSTEGEDPRLQHYDPDTHAEMLALGKMLKKHTTAKALLDASYNRYAFDDDDGLPAWFVADEQRHFKPQLPVSKAEVEAIKARFRDIAARPVARVAEARARKRIRVEKSMAKAKKQAENVLESEELQGRSRAKALARIGRGKGKEVRKQSRVSVVANRSGSHGLAASKAKSRGSKVNLVDPRLKKDARAAKRQQNRSKRARHR